MVSMLISNKAHSVATCLIIYAVLFIITNYLRIAVFSYYGEVTLDGISNNATRIMLEFLYDFLPTGQSLQISSGIILRPYSVILYSLLNIALTTVWGVFVFKRKDIK